MKMLLNVCIVSLLVFYKDVASMAIVKEPVPGSRNGETIQTPEATNVRIQKTETNSLDEAKPQFPGELKETASPNPISSLAKRCARPGVVGMSHASPLLSLTRRDLTQLRIKQCESCKSRRNCKDNGQCPRCKLYCDGLPSSQDSEPINPIITEKRDIPAQAAVILASRFQGDDEETNLPRYYSLGATDTEPLMSLLSKLFNVPQTFEKFILLGKLKGSKVEENFKEIAIIDLGQVFGTQKKTKATVHQFDEHLEKINVLAEDLNKRFDEAMLQQMKENGNSQLSMDEVRRIIDQVMREPSTLGSSATTPVPETETRCADVDEAMNNLLDVLPTKKDKPQKNDEYTKKLVHLVDVPTQEDEEEDIKNPPVIQDSYNLESRNAPEEATVLNILDVKSAPSSDSQVTDTTVEAPQNDDGLVPDQTIHLPEDLEKNVFKVVEDSLKVASQEPEDAEDIATRPRLQATEDLQTPMLNTQELEAPVQEPQPQEIKEVQAPQRALAEDIVKTILKPQNWKAQEMGDVQAPQKALAEDMIKEMVQPQHLESTNGPVQQLQEIGDVQTPQRALAEDLVKTALSHQEPTLEAQPEEMKDVQAPQRALAEDVTRIISRPQEPKAAENVAPREDFPSGDNLDENRLEEDGNGVISQFKNRDKFLDSSEEKSGYFGSLVPAKNSPSIDPRVKKLFYVGDNINLPLKMFQDENGVMKLRVDTDALCHCKNTTCTRKHAEDRVKSRENDREEVVPELQVRFGDDNHNDLMNSFVDSLHTHDENSDVFKRSALMENDNVEDREKLELENEIEKLDETIEQYRKKNKELLTANTVELLNDFQKTKDLGRMVTLASDMFSWMKDLAMKRS